jgi:Mor family transcriptional regulator
MKMKNYQEYIVEAIQTWTVEDMPNPDLQYIAECCGVDVAIKLILHCAGTQNISIPMRALDSLRDRYIRENHDASNTRHSVLRLAKQVGCGTSHVNKVLRLRDDESSHQITLMERLAEIENTEKKDES